MILIGRYLSPFVRRVGVTLHLYNMPFEHRPMMVFGDDKDALRQYNPLTRVPALVLDDGETIVDSAAILDHLDQTVGPEQALIPSSGRARRNLLNLLGIATGAAEKAVLTVYEKRMRPEEKWHAPWVEMCSTQAKDGMEFVDQQFVGPWSAGEHLTQLDVSLVAYWQFIEIANPDLAAQIDCPNVKVLTARAMEMDAFQHTAP